VDTHVDKLSVGDRRALFAEYRRMGVTWVRIGAPWYALQPKAGPLDQSALGNLDQTVADATANRLRVLMNGDQAPGWAGGGDHTASQPAAYGSFMGMVARHFAGRAAGTGPAYELMNEPNGQADDQRRYAGSAEYAHAACAAYRAIKSVDPVATVAAGSLAVNDWEGWLSQSLAAGLGHCFDVLSAHPYSGPAVLQRIRDVAARAGVPHVRIWVTEFGYSTCSTVRAGNEPDKGCVSLEAQADGFVATLRNLARDYPWVEVAIIYEAEDEPDATGDTEQHFGLFTAITRPGAPLRAKPAVRALSGLYHRG
jgi:hypothetical protein